MAELLQDPSRQGSALTSTNNDILGTTDDAHVAFLIHDANVARSHPHSARLVWVSLQGFIRSLWILPIALHDDVSGGLIVAFGSVSVRNKALCDKTEKKGTNQHQSVVYIDTLP